MSIPIRMRVREVLQQTADQVYDLEAKPEDLDLAGWVAPDFETVFRDIAQALPDEALILEVGSWKGASANVMANTLRGLRKPAEIVAIDTWLGAPEFWTWGLQDQWRGISLARVNGYPTVYKTFIRNAILQGNSDYITPFPISSVQGAEVLKYYKVQADLAYIDASHEENAVYTDLEAYWPLIKQSGSMFGDDYNWPGVKKAVDKFTEENGLPLSLSGIVWKVVKPCT